MQGHPEDCTRTSSRASHKDLYKIMLKLLTACHKDLHKKSPQGPAQEHALQGPLRRFHQDLYKIFSQGIVKDLDQDLHARTPQRIPRIPRDHTIRDRHKRSCCCCCCWRGSCTILMQETPRASQKSFHTSTSATWHLQDLHARTSSGRPQRDLHKIFC